MTRIHSWLINGLSFIFDNVILRLQLNPALTDLMGVKNLIYNRQNSLRAKIRNKKKQVEETINLHP